MASAIFWSVDSIPPLSKQCQPPRRSALGQENLVQKKRSFKKHASQNGRGKQQYPFEAISVGKEEVVKRAKEAQRKAEESMDRAVRKRRRAQILMENADLATSLAAMAVKIADSAQLAEITDASKKDISGDISWSWQKEELKGA